MSATPKNAWGRVKTLPHSIYDKPDAEAVHAQFDRILDALVDKLPAVEQHDEWTEIRRYIGLDVLARCRIRPVPGTDSTASQEVTIPALSA